MNEKTQLYLEAGAVEVWLVPTQGNISFFNKKGELKSTGFGIEVMPLYSASQ